MSRPSIRAGRLVVLLGATLLMLPPPGAAGAPRSPDPGRQPRGDVAHDDPEPAPPPRAVEAELEYFTAAPRSVPAGGRSTLSWSVRAGRGVVVRLNDEQVAAQGQRSVTPSDRDEEYRLTAEGDAKKPLSTVVVGVDPCPTSKGRPRPRTGQCARPGRAGFDFERPARHAANLYVWNDDADPDAAAEALLNPPRRGLLLDACASDPGRGGRIEEYRWHLTRLGSGPRPAPPVFLTRQQCRTWASVPSLGLHRVRLEAHTAHDSVLTAEQSVDVRELLIVSLGDSMASGEGNPDNPGDYVPSANPAEPFNKTAADWRHDRCHRSARSGHWHAADRIERADPRSTVSFVALACSGAGAASLTSDPHRGQAPQLEALQQLLCRHGACHRPIDRLLLSVGINDLVDGGISKLLSACSVKPGEQDGDCDARLAEAEGNVDGTRERLSSIRARISELGLPVRRVLISEYPVNMFTDADGKPRSSCGVFDLDVEQSAQLLWIGQRLNEHIRRFAEHSSGWHFVGGVVDAFRGRGYCEDDDVRYFGTWGGSQDTQGDEDGTAHPNGKGHGAIAGLISELHRQLPSEAAGSPAPQPKAAR